MGTRHVRGRSRGKGRSVVRSVRKLSSKSPRQSPKHKNICYRGSALRTDSCWIKLDGLRELEDHSRHEVLWKCGRFDSNVHA